MALSVSVDGVGTWKPADVVSVSAGSGVWLPAKSVKCSDGAGNWVIVWVPRSTVTVTGPAWALSAESGAGAAVPPVIVPTPLTVTLSAPDSVGAVLLQASDDGVNWAQIASWVLPTDPVLVHEGIFPTAGAWTIRATIVHRDDFELVSDTHTLTVYTKSITATASLPSPYVFDRFMVEADSSAQPLPDPISVRWLSRIEGGTVDVQFGLGPWAATQLVWQEMQGPHEWYFEETYADGSVLTSSPTLVDAMAIVHFHELVPVGQPIQVAMDRASRWFTINKVVPVDFDDEQAMACVELEAGSLHNIATTPLRYRRGVRLLGNGATIKGNGSHIFHGDDHGGGEYNSPDRDWLLLNVLLDASQKAGGVSTAHVARFRMQEVTVKNIGGGKHHIEINSSGGTAGPNYNCQILDCTLFQEGKAQGVRTEDEAIQLDYSWEDAAPNVANDGTVTNNVLILGCTIYQVPRAIGGHVYNSKLTKAEGIHSHIRIESNTFRDINPMTWGDAAPNSPASEGAVRVYYWRDVTIVGNTWSLCYQPLMIYAPDDSLGAAYPMGLTQIVSNVFENCGGGNGRHCAYGNSAGGNSIGQVHFERNTLRGTWGGGPNGYFAGFDDTTGIVPGEPNGVVIEANRFEPSNFDVPGEASYNKYREGNITNLTGVLITNNTISDGSVNNT